MRKRLPLALATTALLVVLLGSTSLGEAARELASAVPPFAKKAGYAKSAGFAKNAGAVGGIKASRQPKPGLLVPLGADGKFPAAVGQVGPQGPKGDAGEAGPAGPTGLSELEIVTAQSVNDNLAGLKTATASCPAGKKVISGGAQIQSSPVFPITQSSPLPDLSGWKAQGYASAAGAFWAVVAYAVCAKVA